MSADSLQRSRLRTSIYSQAPEDAARVLVDRLRRAVPCESCGGYGVSNVVRGDGERKSLGVPCGRCAGTGSPFRALVELAAYCGHEAARLSLPQWRRCAGAGCYLRCAAPTWHHPVDNSGLANAHIDCVDIGKWVAGLARWGQEIQVRAAVAAARFIHSRAPVDHGGSRALVLLEAAESLDHKAWCDAWGALSGGAEWCRQWLPTPYNAMPNVHDMSIRVCAGMSRTESTSGEPAVRSAIQSALVSWALGGDS